MQVGIDLGGTKIEIIAINDLSEEIFRKRIATPQGDYAAMVIAIAALISECEAHCHNSAEHIGIGIPGAISPTTGLIKNANSTCLIGKRLDHDVSALVKRPIKLSNDADCFALSEAMDGSGKTYNSVFGVILGTGVGGGIVVNKSLLQGPNAISGEWGHNPLPWLSNNDLPGRACYCGKKDCVETYLSGPGFTNAFNQRHNQTLTTKQIWHAAATGDVTCRMHCHLYFEQLAKALSSVINILDPEVIVLGGGMSNQTTIYQNMPKLLQKYVFSDSVTTPVLQAKFGDSSGVRGAAWL